MKDGEVGSMTAVRAGSGPKSWAENAWHTESAQAYPEMQAVFDDLRSCIQNYVQTGHAPEQPILEPSGNVVTIGSCFAAELRHFLCDVGLSSNSFWVPSGLNNTFALKDFLSWIATGEETASGYRYERNVAGEVEDWKPSHEREFYLAKLKDASGFVFTIGLAEVWEDKQTSKVFWRGIPESIFDESRHRFRLSSVSENVANLRSIVDTIRAINKQAPIVFTLSPVPLKATFQKNSCVTADCVSKSTLRVALHELMQQAEVGVYYWPSFEIVKWLGCHLPYAVYGVDDAVVRHVSRFMVLQILRSFTTAFYGEEVSGDVFNDYEASLERVEGKPGQPPLLFKGHVVSA